MKFTQWPERIVCLSEETTELLYLMGEEDRIAGISVYTVRPPEARHEKPRVSAYLTAKIDKILNLEPDLVLAFSDIQAPIVSELIKEGLQVHCFNQRRLPEIFSMISQLACMIGQPQKGEALNQQFIEGLEEIKRSAERFKVRPKVYFEGWNDPLISAIGWVSDLIEVAGGDDCFAELAKNAKGKDRIIADPSEVIDRAPDIIIGSWCGKRFRPGSVIERPGWDVIPAVKNNEIYEIKSSDIQQPGPACLTDGVRKLHDIFLEWHKRHHE